MTRGVPAQQAQRQPSSSSGAQAHAPHTAWHVIVSSSLLAQPEPHNGCSELTQHLTDARAFSGAGAGAGGVLTERRVKVRGLEKYKVRLALADAADVPVWQCAPVEALDSVLAKNVIPFCARRLYGFCLFYPP